MDHILEVQNLKKYFKTAKGMLHAVDDISFQIRRGSILGVVGESGCGKSTLGRTILHLLDSTGGRILFEGRDITQVDQRQFKALRREMQIIFQDPFASLNPRMCVKETIGEPLEIFRETESKEGRERRVKEIMEVVGLADNLALSYPHELDGGRRQRIGIARALVLNPKFIVCDEPVSALDVSIQAQILNLMQDLQRERNLTYLFITHDLSVVKHISDHIMVMYLGQMVEYAPTESLFTHQFHPYTKALLSAVPIPKVGAKKGRILLKGEISSPIDPGSGCRFATRCQFATEECMTVSPGLREIAPGHVTACHHPVEQLFLRPADVSAQ